MLHQLSMSALLTFGWFEKEYFTLLQKTQSSSLFFLFLSKLILNELDLLHGTLLFVVVRVD
jgi:hypothetical protein